ncbi:MAG: hypothetical protein WCD38_02985 [Candidatus Tumulicola sp.]
MELFGTTFTLSLGAWRLRFLLALEDSDSTPPPKVPPPHHVRIVPDNEYAR